MKDHIDTVIAQWDDERPDLDSSALGVLSRLIRLGKHIDADLKQALAPFGLDTWSFEVLSALRRQGEPYAMSPTGLRRAALLTSGAMTNRIDRLEEKKLVARVPDPNDRRALQVHLTPEGLRLVDQAIEIRFRVAEALTAQLDANEIDDLTRLLRKLLLAKPTELVPGF